MNESKKKSERAWQKWRFSGAVEPMVLTTVSCLLCAYERMEKMPKSWPPAFCICKECNKEISSS